MSLARETLAAGCQPLPSNPASMKLSMGDCGQVVAVTGGRPGRATGVSDQSLAASPGAAAWTAGNPIPSGPASARQPTISQTRRRLIIGKYLAAVRPGE